MKTETSKITPKCTREDIERLKARGVDHWMFDEMEFEDEASEPPNN